MPRIRKDSETLSNSGYSTVSRNRRESDRMRGEYVPLDTGHTVTQRSLSTPAPPREVRTNQMRRLMDRIVHRRKQKYIVFHNTTPPSVSLDLFLLRTKVY